MPSDESMDKVFIHYSRTVANFVRAGVQAKRIEGTMQSFDHELLIGASAYAIGLEHGLAIAVRDIASGRRLLDWMDRVPHEGQDGDRAQREKHVDGYMRVLDDV